MRAERDISANLLAYLRVAWHAPEAVYVEPPERFATGVENRVFGFRLGGVGGPREQPLVAKVYGAHVPPERVRFETVVQNTLVDLGYPAPRILATCEDVHPLGAPVAIMERLPGAPMLEPLTRLQPSAVATVRLLPDLLLKMPRVLAEMQARLHALDAERLMRALADAGLPDEPLSFTAHLRAIDERIGGARLEGLRPGIAWLHDHRPPEPRRRVICHGDFWFGNVIEHGGAVTGVIDWAMGMVAVADPAYDVGITHAVLLRGSSDVSGPLRGLARFVQRHIAARYLDAYRRRGSADLEAARYYGLMRCVDALSWVGERRAGVVGALRSDDTPDMWDVPGSSDGFIAHFREATGIALSVSRATA